MKKFSIIFLLLIIFPYSQVFGQYTVKLRIGELINPMSIYHPEEWTIHSLYADIFDDNNNFVQPSSNYYYYWERDYCDGIGFSVWSSYGYGVYFVNPDGHNNVPSACDPELSFQTYYARATVKINGIDYVSNVVRLPDDSEGTLDQKEVIIKQRNGNNNSIGMFGKKTQDNFLNYTPPFTFYYPATVNSDIFRASQSLISNEKYNKWVNIPDIINHKSLSFLQEQQQFTAQLNEVVDATVNANMVEFPGFPLTVNFKDPWLIDDDSDPLGLRNRGMLADPLPLDNTQNNVGINTSHQGALLNQSGPPNWNPPYYSIKIPSSIYLPNNGGTHNLYLQSWDVSGASLENENSLTTGVVFTNSNANVTANLKGTQLSNNSNAYANNSQRKFIRTPDFTPTLHTVYESMGHVFYETSTDNGQSWILMNNGQPLDNGGGKSPSIDWVTINGTWTYTVIVFQQTEPGTGYPYSIQANVFGGVPLENPFLYPKIQTITIYNSGYQYSDIDAEPVVAMEPGVDDAGIDIVWHTNSGLKLQNAAITLFYNPPFYLLGAAVTVTGTNSSSIHPSLATYRVNNPGYFYLTWEENNVIKYAELYGSSVYNIQTISNFSGYTSNNDASLVVLNDGFARICWKGTYYNWGSRTVFRGINNNHFWSFGQNVGSPNINKADDQNYYALVWNQNENSTFFADNTLSTIREITSIPGKNVQVSNGSTKDQMYAEVFNGQSLPYYFRTSNSIGSYYNLHKITNYAFSSGREGVIAKDTAQFCFTVGDIIVDDQPINFIGIPDSVEFNSREVLNEYLISESFQLTDNSNFLYSIQYGITDSSAADALLSNSNKYISFKLQLIDNQTSEVLGSFDEVTYDQSNIFQYSNLCYQVNTQGIGNREAYLRLIADDNFDPGYSLGEIYSIGNVLEKVSVQTINYSGSETPTTYALSQNFPNPFNPNSTIRYQLPQDGLVTLKIYDILGKEVATLVNEEKASGRYEVNFNASSLASGVYLYRLKSGDFVETKKMLLLK